MQSKSLKGHEGEPSAPIPLVQQSNTKPCTPTIALCRSSRTTRPPQSFSPSLNDILLTNGDELQNYDELQDELELVVAKPYVKFWLHQVSRLS